MSSSLVFTKFFCYFTALGGIAQQLRWEDAGNASKSLYSRIWKGWRDVAQHTLQPSLEVFAAEVMNDIIFHTE